MKTIKDLSSLQTANAFLKNMFFKLQTRWKFKKTSSQVRHLIQLKHQNNKIYKLPFEVFNNPSSLIRWMPTSDRDFSGSSGSELFFNQLLGCLALRGKVGMQNKQKLISYPHIGMLQRNSFDFKIGIFNAVRITLMGDGGAVAYEMKVHSKTYGDRWAQGFIITQKSDRWVTYELPLHNMQIKGYEKKNRSDFSGSEFRHTMVHIVDHEDVEFVGLKIRQIGFRLNSTEDAVRAVDFKKIQFVKTIRANYENRALYQRPYFYEVDDKQQNDALLDALMVGDRVFVHKQLESKIRKERKF